MFFQNKIRERTITINYNWIKKDLEKSGLDEKIFQRDNNYIKAVAFYEIIR